MTGYVEEMKCVSYSSELKVKKIMKGSVGGKVKGK